MWIICDVGFFNIVCQKGDEERDLLTVKARSRKDLEALSNFVPFELPIEESNEADYRFRQKASAMDVANGIRQIIREIDYPKTKPKLMERNPKRASLYLSVWDMLYEIQENEA